MPISLFTVKKHIVFEISSRPIEISSSTLENSKIARVEGEFRKMSEIFYRVNIVYSHEIGAGAKYKCGDGKLKSLEIHVILT